MCKIARSIVICNVLISPINFSVSNKSDNTNCLRSKITSNNKELRTMCI